MEMNSGGHVEAPSARSSSVAARFGGVFAMVRHFVPRPHEEDFFADRMTVRVCKPGAGKNNPFGPRSLIAHRADPNVALNDGRRLLGGELTPLRGWYPIDVLHFPIRSLQQCEHKYMLRAGAPISVYGAAYEAHQEGRFRVLRIVRGW